MGSSKNINPPHISGKKYLGHNIGSIIKAVPRIIEPLRMVGVIFMGVIFEFLNKPNVSSSSAVSKIPGKTVA